MDLLKPRVCKKPDFFSFAVPDVLSKPNTQLDQSTCNEKLNSDNIKSKVKQYVYCNKKCYLITNFQIIVQFTSVTV